MTYYRKYRSS